MTNRPVPKAEAPALTFKTDDGSRWDLSQERLGNFAMIVFYRGLHCPVCKKYLEELNGLIEDFAEREVHIVAVSMDTEVRVRKSRKDWSIDKVKLGYGISRTDAENWGLYLSEGIKEGEPGVFNEPGLFLINPENKVYYVAINSSPCGRPYLPSLLKSIDFVLENDYPARGELV